MAAKMFAQGIVNLHNADIDLNANTIMAVLVNSVGYAALQHETHANFGDFQESTWGIKKTNGSTLMERKTITMSAASVVNDTVTWDSATTLTWTNVGGTPGANQKVAGILVFASLGATETADLLICSMDFTGGNITTNGSDINVDFNANGLFQAAY